MSLATSLESSPLSTNRAAVPFSSNARDRLSISSSVLRRPLTRMGEVVIGERTWTILSVAASPLGLCLLLLRQCFV